MLTKPAQATWILLAAVWLSLYWPLLAGEVPAFRDAYHFYYPLECWLDQRAQQGDVFPQFNPCDGTGVNLVGESSTGLFYPVRVLWWLPGLNVAQRMGWVLLVHTALAGFGAAYAARRMKLGPAPQLLAASAYSLSGPVFFQHVNPIYLISSAWLPWVLAECWMMTRRCNETLASRSDNHNSPDLRAHAQAVLTANETSTRQNETRAPGNSPGVRWWMWIIACCMMFLGGDPQATLHCGLISLLAIGVVAYSSRSLVPTFRLSWRLALAVLIVTGITAMQWLPTWYWLQATSQPPVISTSNAALDNVPTLLQALQSPTYDVTRGSPYAYSIAPWHLVTLLCSNCLGHVVPTNARYLAAWSAEPRMWTASLSIGLVTILLTISSWWQPAARRDTRYLWWVALFSGTAMLGNYAPVWMLRNALHWLGLDTSWLPGDEVGGMYWLLTQLVPGYDAFRYPAKWSPIFALSLTLCAAHGLAQWEHNQVAFSRVLRSVIVVTVCISLAFFGFSLHPIIRQATHQWIEQAQPDAWLGPIDARAAFRHTVSGLLVACIVLLAALVAQKRMPLRWQAWCLVLLVVVESSWSARQWLIATAAPQVGTSQANSAGQHLTRFWAGIGQANIARDIGPQTLLQEKMTYQQQFALAKLHLLDPGRANLCAFMSLTPQALGRVRHQLAQHDSLRADNPQLDKALAWLGVQSRLVRSNRLYWKNVDRAAPLLELRDHTDQSNTLHIKYFYPGRIGVHVQSINQTSLTIRLFQDGGWRAILSELDDSLSESQAASPAARKLNPKPSHLGLFQSLDVPPGRWNIELRYQAPGLTIGLWISALTVGLWTLSFCPWLLQIAPRYFKSTNTTCDGLPTGTY